LRRERLAKNSGKTTSDLEVGFDAPGGCDSIAGERDSAIHFDIAASLPQETHGEQLALLTGMRSGEDNAIDLGAGGL